MPRLANSTDLESILQLAEDKDYADWPSRGPQDPSPAFLLSLRDSAALASEYDLIITEDERDVTGFLVLRKQLTRSITSDRESVIQDWFAPQVVEQNKLLEFAVETARSYDSGFLTTEISPSDSRDQELLEASGFRLESHKISVATAECRMPEGSPYLVRPVEPDDAFLIAILNSTMLHHTLCAGRDYDLGELTLRSIGILMEQVSGQGPQNAGLALTLDGEMVGHLLIDFNDQMGYIADLALAQDHWGGTAVRHLMRAGSRLLFQKNIPLFVGDVSATNRRALVVAQRALGFSVERRRYGLTL